MHSAIYRLAAAAALALISCSGGTEQGEGAFRSARQPLGATATRVFGFESTSDWTLTSGVKQVSTTRVEGQRSLAISGVGFTEIRSIALSSLGTFSSVVKLDILLPLSQPNPFWYGSLALYVNAPSRGVSNVLLGQHDLTGRPLNAFQRLNFAVPQDTLTRLQGSYTDLTFRIVLNVPQGGGSYLLDRLQATTDVVSAPALGGTFPACVPGGRCAIQISLPRGMSLDQARFVGMETLMLGDRTRIQNEASALTTIVNSGRGQSSLGVEAKSGDAWSIGQLVLRDRARIEGVARTRTAPVLSSGAVITGQTILNQELEPEQLRGWVVDIPASFGAGLRLEPNQVGSLAPGAHDALVVKTGATAKLRTGRYFVKTFDSEPQSTIELDQAQGPVEVYVITTLIQRGRVIAKQTGVQPNWLLGYVGTSDVHLEAPVNATVVAPFALLSLRSTPPPLYSGSFFARRIDTQPGVTVTLRPSLVPTLVDDGRLSCIAKLAQNPAHAALPQQQREQEILALCVAPGIPPCDARMTSIANADRRAAAQQYVEKLIGMADYLAIARDRSRKLHRARLDPALLQAYCQGDADGDLIPTSRDNCPNTPPLTTTDDNGCTVTGRPPAPPREIVDIILGGKGIVDNPLCDGAPRPSVPSPVLIDTCQIETLAVSNQPPGCDVWYEVNIFDLRHNENFYLAFKDSESVLTTSSVIFVPFAAEGGDRGKWTLMPNRPEMVVTARATNGNGQQSAWSAPVFSEGIPEGTFSQPPDCTLVRP